MKWQRQELVGRRAELDALRRDGAEPALLVVRGPEGSGRTALLRRFRAEATGTVLDLGGRDGQPAWDEFRARALLTAVRTEFETFGGGPRVAESIEAVSRLCVPESYSTPARRHRLLAALGVLLARLRTRLVIVVDDADDVPVSALAPMHRAGHTVVAACGADAPRELCSLADRIVDLAPLTDEEVGRLLWQVAAAPVDEAVPRALRSYLGPLYGHAGTLVSTVESLWDEGRLARVHGVLALRSPRAPIALPAGHRLLAEVDALGEVGRALVSLAAAEPGLRVDQIPALAAVTGHAAHEYGHAADRLVRTGVLVHGVTGRLRCRSRAIAAAVVEPAEVRADDLRQLVSAGDHERLAAFVGEAVGRAEVGEDLAAAAALAAIHLGREVPEHVRDALGDRLDDGPIALADRWLAGAAIGVEEFAAGFAPLRRQSSLSAIDGRAAGAEESVPDALALRDLVPVFRSVLGPVYGSPTDGPVAAHHRVCRGYADGDWVDALSAARELELMSEVDNRVARLLAAEICGWRGEDRQAAAWLAAAGEDTAFPGLRGWVATGLRDHAGEDAFEYGWGWYTARAAELEEPGAARLLTRLATIAVDAGDRYHARAVLRETQARYGQSAETTLFVRGLVEADGASVRAAERVIRKRGNRFELALACQRVARVDTEPHPWLSEAYELARSIGAAKLVSTTKRTMAGCGVAVPVRRSRQNDVSDVERQIIELIRLGRTNRQIALALRVSAKTVEKHLTRLFAKAGCRTRHALAMSGLGARQELVGA
jgi:DNA-binding CsgD family transcriptional regulator